MLPKEFFLAGRAEFTVENTTTQQHYTFRVNKVVFENSEYYFVFDKVKSGKWGYIGVLNPKDGGIRLTKRSIRQKVPLKHQDLLVVSARWVFGRIFQDIPLPENVIISHCGKCGRCRKKLTHPDSLRTGLGPECRKCKKYRSKKPK
jgi:hypothetical protein